MNIENKTVNFLGDSITFGSGASSNEKCFVSVFGKKTGAIVRNYGISGTRISRQQTPDEFERLGNFCDRAKTMEDADIIGVFGGTNDYGHGDAPLGTFDDRTPDTFYGACHTLLSYLQERYAGKALFLITPIHRMSENEKNMHGCVLLDYVKALRETAEYYSVPVLDLYKNYGIYPEIQSVRESFMPDGLHPSDLGHELLADKIISYIKAL